MQSLPGGRSGNTEIAIAIARLRLLCKQLTSFFRKKFLLGLVLAFFNFS
jgi:hypothetical protein